MEGILLIHGFAGSRKEIISLGVKLIELGYKVSMPVLPGHEENYIKMSMYGRKDWLKHISEAYDTLKKEVDTVTVIGFSMGGLLSFNLHNKDKLKRIITINTPIKYWNFPQIYKNLKLDTSDSIKKYSKSCIDKPVRSLYEFKMLLIETKKILKSIDTEVHIIQTLDDDTTVPNSAEYIQKNIKGKSRIYLVENGSHTVHMSKNKNEVIDIVSKILEENTVFK